MGTPYTEGGALEVVLKGGLGVCWGMTGYSGGGGGPGGLWWVTMTSSGGGLRYVVVDVVMVGGVTTILWTMFIS